MNTEKKEIRSFEEIERIMSKPVKPTSTYLFYVSKGRFKMEL